MEFEQAFSGVLLDNAVLDAPCRRPMHNWRDAPPIRPGACRPCPAPSPGAQLRAWIVRRLPLGLPTRVQAAQALGLSERTLARQCRRRA